MLKKNCHKVFGSQKSKLTVLEQVFKTAGVINPPPIRNRVNSNNKSLTPKNFILVVLVDKLNTNRVVLF